MKTTSFHHALTRPVVSLAALALAGAALLALAPAAHAHGSERMSAHGAAHPMHGGKHGRRHDGGSSGPSMRLSERMLDRVDASPEQRARIRRIMEAARTDLRASHEAGRGLRDQAAKLLAQPSVDAGAVETLRQQMVARHDAASKRMTQALVEAAQVLTPEQRQKLAGMAQQRRGMMERHDHERRAPEAPKS